MSLKQQLTDDMKAAMKAGEKDRLAVIRLINAAIKQREVDERIELDDAAVLAVLEKMVKQRKDSVSQFEAANREVPVMTLHVQGLLLEWYRAGEGGLGSAAARSDDQVDMGYFVAVANELLDSIDREVASMQSTIYGFTSLALLISPIVKPRMPPPTQLPPGDLLESISPFAHPGPPIPRKALPPG